jgi:amidase
MAEDISTWADLSPTIGTSVYESDIVTLQEALSNKVVTSQELVAACIARIEAFDRDGPQVNAVIELNPEAMSIAAALDEERVQLGPRGPLHGIPILIKDNIDTADQMHTTAGSLALMNSKPARDATVVRRLREAGAVILGKTNLSEWANFRSTHSASGWSGRGRQTRNPYALDRSPGGSSSGSGAAIAASLAVAALGTETNGSIINPSTINGLVGIKPTVGLTSRSGVIPISHSQDTVGPMARSVRDAAIILGAIAGPDNADAATANSAGHAVADYTQYLVPDGLRGKRIGVARKKLFGYHPATDHIVDQTIAIMREAGAIIIDPADISTAEEMDGAPSTLDVMLYEFKADLNAYLATREPTNSNTILRSLADIIDYNKAHANLELPYFGQELFEMAQAKGPLTDEAYLKALATNHRLSRDEGIDKVMETYNLDALIAPSSAPAWSIDPIVGEYVQGGSTTPAALAGYPIITLPIGQVHGLPVGLSFMGQAYSEPVLLSLAYALEELIPRRSPPQFLRTVPID